MAGRKGIKAPPKNGFISPSRLKSGYEGMNIPEDFHIPACGISDVDRAVFNLFDKDINFVVENRGTTEKVPVIFATGERFALLKRHEPLRDDAGRLVIPLISIRRTGIDQSRSSSATPGPRADTGEMVIKKKLSKKDPRYQALLNKSNLMNQSNVASPANVAETDPNRNAEAGRVGTRRPDAQFTGDSYPGYLLNNQLDKNIFEIITIPNPVFFSVKYEVVFWTQYTQHMNQVIETFMSSYSPVGSGRSEFKITSDKGYYFVAFVDDTFTNQDNFDDFTDQERIVRYQLGLTVTGYLIAPENPGDPVPFRRFLSAPDVSFEVFQTNAKIVTRRGQDTSPVSGDLDSFVLSNVEDIARDGQPVDSDRRIVEKVETNQFNPFTDQNEIQVLKVLSRNQRKGESVLKARIVNKLDDI